MGSSPKEDRPYQQKNEIREAYQDIKKRNTELKEIMDSLKRENARYKELYNKHKQRITALTDLLEKSTKIFVELLDNSNSALQIARLPLMHSPILPLRPPCPGDVSPKPGSSGEATKTAGSPNVRNEAGTRRRLQLKNGHEKDQDVQNSLKAMSLVSSNLPNAEPSTNQVRNVTRRKFHIEPLDLQKLGEMSAAAEEEDEAENCATELSAQENYLSTILEENSNNLKEVSVQLTRLSEDVVYRHLRKQKNPLCNNSSLNVTDSFTNDSPAHSSTPCGQLEIMTQTPDRSSYITTRKKGRSSTNDTSRIVSTRVSPKKEQQSCSSSGITLSPKQEQSLAESNKTSNCEPPALVSGKKRCKTSTEVAPESTKRPTRTARPKDLKEASLMKKMRRT